MKKIVMQMLGVMSVVAVMGVLTPAAHAQAPSLKAEAAGDWTRLKDTMHKISDAMAADKFGYKSTPAQRSYAEQILHVAQTNVFLGKLLGGKGAAPMIDAKATAKDVVIKALDDSFDYVSAAIAEQTDATMGAAIMNPPAFMGPSSRARVVSFLIGHTNDIYGQMVVYLRLNGGVPPASQRP